MKWWWLAVSLFCEWRAYVALNRAEAKKAAFDAWKDRARRYRARS